MIASQADRAIKPLSKIRRVQNNDLKNIHFFFSEMQQFEVGTRVQPNFPIVILSLLTGFKKCLKPMERNRSVKKLFIWSIILREQC